MFGAGFGAGLCCFFQQGEYSSEECVLVLKHLTNYGGFKNSKLRSRYWRDTRTINAIAHPNSVIRKWPNSAKTILVLTRLAASSCCLIGSMRNPSASVDRSAWWLCGLKAGCACSHRKRKCDHGHRSLPQGKCIDRRTNPGHTFFSCTHSHRHSCWATNWIFWMLFFGKKESGRVAFSSPPCKC